MSLVFSLFPLIFVGVGALFVYMGIKGFRTAGAQRSWPTTNGTVVESSIQRESFASRRRSGFSMSRSSGGTTRGIRIGGGSYYPRILYNYQVANQTYSGSSSGATSSRGYSHSRAQDIIAQYPTGATIPVYYDPANPADSILQPGKAGCGLVFVIAIGVVVMLFGLSFLWAGLALFG